ncbi:MAG: phosphatidylserine decarboxylase [Gammaproteobacteria bacterium]
MSRYSIIAREGLAPVLASVLAAVLVMQSAGFYASLGFWVFSLLLALIFRDPDRDVPAMPLAIVCPADGRVLSISMTHDPYLDRPAIRIVIQMNPYGVFSTRSPVEGKVLDPPNIPPGVPHGVWLRTNEGDDIVLVMNRGRLHSTPRCYVRIGERVGQGQRCGFIHLGGQVDLYLPESSRTLATAGDWVRGGSDVIAKLIH